MNKDQRPEDNKLVQSAPIMYDILKTILFEGELTDRTMYWIKGFFQEHDPELIKKAEENINPKKN